MATPRQSLRPPRARRQMLLGSVPLVVVAVVLVSVLGVELAATRATLDAATSRAQATVTTTGIGVDGRQIELSYVDAAGDPRTGRLSVTRAGTVPIGASVQVSYDPAVPDRLYAAGDATSARAGNLAVGIALVTAVTLACVLTTVVRIARRVARRRRPTRPVTAHRVTLRRGLIDRRWLRLSSEGQSSWVPVYWEPALDAVPDTDPLPVEVHGDPGRDGLLVFTVAGATMWPSGRRRSERPRGVERESTSAGSGGLVAQLRADAVPLLSAPVLGLLWAYVDGSGADGFWVATAFCAALLLWLPSTYGSDPT